MLLGQEKEVIGGSRKTIAPDTYTRDYYESHCDGHAEFRTSCGAVLPERLRIPLKVAEMSSGMTVLDVGSGRGEVLMHASRVGARAFGFDYAVPALEIAAQAIAKERNANQVLLHQGNAQQLPYPQDFFDRAFMLDVVEHLYPEELHESLCEIRRVLRPKGQLIIHTMPNTWYYRFGYPPYRLLQRIRGNLLPADPRDRWGYKQVHVNEQNPIALSRALVAAGLKPRVWLESIHSYNEEQNPIVRLFMRALVSVYPFRFIFCDDVFALAVK